MNNTDIDYSHEADEDADKFIPADAPVTQATAHRQVYIPDSTPCDSIAPYQWWRNYVQFKKPGEYTIEISSSGIGEIKISNLDDQGKPFELKTQEGAKEKKVKVTTPGWYLVEIKNSNGSAVCPPKCWFWVKLDKVSFILKEITPLPPEEKEHFNDPDPCDPKNTGSANTKTNSVVLDIAFGFVMQTNGMKSGYLSILSHHITRDTFKPKSLLFRHLSQRHILSIEGDLVNVMWETGEIVSYRNSYDESVLHRYGHSQTRTSLMEKLDQDGLSTCENPIFYQETMQDGFAIRYSANSMKPVLYFLPNRVSISEQELSASLDVIYDGDALRQVYEKTDGLMDIEILDDYSYRISWYAPTNILPKTDGLYGHIGTPEKTYTIAGSISQETGNRLSFIESLRDIRSSITTWWNRANEWVMIKGDGADAQITRLVMKGIPLNKYARIITKESPDGTILSCTKDTLCTFDYGTVLIRHTEGYGTKNPLSTRYEYNNQGRMIAKILPDNTLIRYTFDGLGREIEQIYDWEGGGEMTTRTVYANLRQNDYRPASITTAIITSDKETVLNNRKFIYEETAFLSRTTISETAIGSPHTYLTIQENYGPDEPNLYARGMDKFVQLIDGKQSFYTYESSNEYGSIYKQIRETRVQYSLITNWSERFISYFDVLGNEICNETYLLLADNTWELINKELCQYNAGHQWTRRERGNGRVTTRTMMCRGPLIENDEDGVLTTYSYNTAKECIEIIRSATPAKPETIVSVIFDGAGREITRRTDIGAMTTVTHKTYDLQNRILTETDALGRLTQYNYPYNGSAISKKIPTGATYITHYHSVTGAVTAESGTGQRSIWYAPELVAEGIRTLVFAQDTTSPEFIPLFRRTENGFGEIIREEQATTLKDIWLETKHSYNAQGHLFCSREAEMAPIVRKYDAVGHIIQETVAMDESPTTKNSFITDYAITCESYPDGIYRIVTQTEYNLEGAPLISTQATLISNLNDLIESKRIIIDIDGNISQQWMEYGDGTERLQKTQIPTSKIIATSRIIDGFITEKIDIQGVKTRCSRSFLATGILETTRDGRDNVTTIEQDTIGRITKQTDAVGCTMTVAYDVLSGNISTLTDAEGNQSYFSYDDRGRKVAEWGTTIKPALYAYNESNQIIQLITFRSSIENLTPDIRLRTDGDTTTWTYDPAAGVLLHKVYSDGTEKSMVYNALNQQTALIQSRGIITNFSYSPKLGKVIEVSHNDNTHGVIVEYNHLGLVASVIDASGEHLLSYNSKGRLHQETLFIGDETINLFENYDIYGRNISYLVDAEKAATR